MRVILTGAHQGWLSPLCYLKSGYFRSQISETGISVSLCCNISTDICIPGTLNECPSYLSSVVVVYETIITYPRDNSNNQEIYFPWVEQMDLVWSDWFVFSTSVLTAEFVLCTRIDDMTCCKATEISLHWGFIQFSYLWFCSVHRVHSTCNPRF